MKALAIVIASASQRSSYVKQLSAPTRPGWLKAKNTWLWHPGFCRSRSGGKLDFVVRDRLASLIFDAERALPVVVFVDHFEDHDIDSLVQGHFLNLVTVHFQGPSLRELEHFFAIQKQAALV